MKARSLVFDSVQRPWTILGIPPLMGVFTLVSALLTFVVFGMWFQWPRTAAACLFGILGIGLSVSWRLRAREHHIETLWRNGRKFWRRGGDGDCRILAAGGPGESR